MVTLTLEQGSPERQWLFADSFRVSLLTPSDHRLATLRLRCQSWEGCQAEGTAYPDSRMLPSRFWNLQSKVVPFAKWPL